MFTSLQILLFPTDPPDVGGLLSGVGGVNVKLEAAMSPWTSVERDLFGFLPWIAFGGCVCAGGPDVGISVCWQREKQGGNI